MNIERPIFEEEDEEAIAASIARARAQIAAGKGVPHEEVVKWLKTWGTPEAGPPPAEWFK
jgi:predicted transcriptional regulator